MGQRVGWEVAEHKKKNWVAPVAANKLHHRDSEKRSGLSAPRTRRCIGNFGGSWRNEHVLRAGSDKSWLLIGSKTFFFVGEPMLEVFLEIKIIK